MKFREESPDILYLEDPTEGLSRENMDALKIRASRSPRKRARFCVHQNPQDGVQEMFIALKADTYLPPHRHVNKVESYHIVEGRAYLVFFEDSGKIRHVTEMGAESSGLVYYCRAPQQIFHTFYIVSDYLILHETTNGPFNPAETMPAPWAPAEKDVGSIGQFRRGLLTGIQDWLRAKGS